MSGDISILEIRKIKFIDTPNYDNYNKLAEKIDKNKEIFDNKFFAEATRKTISRRDTKGLLFISQLYMQLNRIVEAEHILFRAHNIDENDNEVLYHLFDILCRRKQLGLLSSIGNKLDKSKNELLYIKSLFKYLIVINETKELEDLLLSYFEKYKTDWEFVRLIFISGIRNNNYKYTNMVSRTKFRQEFFSDLTEPTERRIKNHFYIMIINLLKVNIYDIKNC